MIKKELIKRVKNKFKCSEREAIIWLMTKRDFFNNESIFSYASKNDNNYRVVLSLL